MRVGGCDEIHISLPIHYLGLVKVVLTNVIYVAVTCCIGKWRVIE